MKKKLVLFLTFLMANLFVFGAGEKVSNIIFENIDTTKKVNLYDVMNKNGDTVLIVAAEWCDNCSVQSEKTQKLYDANKSKNIKIITIYVTPKSSKKAVQDFLKENKYTYPVYYDMQDEALNEFEVERVPYTVVIDKNKNVVYRDDQAKLEDFIKQRNKNIVIPY